VLYWYPVYINNLPAPVPGLVGVVLYPPLKPPPTELVLDPRPQHLLNQELVLVSCLYRLDTSTTPTKPGTGAGRLFI
jgi:hypothetical protein